MRWWWVAKVLGSGLMKNRGAGSDFNLVLLLEYRVI